MQLWAKTPARYQEVEDLPFQVFIKLGKLVDRAEPSGKDWVIQPHFTLCLGHFNSGFDGREIIWVWGCILGDLGLEVACISRTGVLDLATNLE